MDITSTLHNHCTLCDGESTPREMINAAISLGFTDFGMSCHGYAPFDPECSIESEKAYLMAMSRLKKEYSGKIRLWCGIEEDLFAPSACREEYDYIIGDVHYAHDPASGENIAIDGSENDFARALNLIYGGDVMRLIAQYYENMVKAAEQKPDILGHFDLIVKNNRSGAFFREDDDRYISCALEALRACIDCGVIFEVNTGAMARQKRAAPYPAGFLLKELNRLGGRVTLSADCHRKDLLVSHLDAALSAIQSAGFKTILVWENGKFTEKEI